MVDSRAWRAWLVVIARSSVPTRVGLGTNAGRSDAASPRGVLHMHGERANMDSCDRSECWLHGCRVFVLAGRFLATRDPVLQAPGGLHSLVHGRAGVRRGAASAARGGVPVDARVGRGSLLNFELLNTALHARWRRIILLLLGLLLCCDDAPPRIIRLAEGCRRETDLSIL